MAKNKTTETFESVDAYLQSVTDVQKREDAYRLIALMQKATGKEPKMWGPSIVGFGKYHYQYESGHQGEAPLLGFSPRKAAISIYAYTGLPEHAHLLKNLGKFKMGKACLYVKKLSDIQEAELVKIMQASIAFLTSKYQVID